MFHFQDKKIKDLLLTGNFGLEKESLRIDQNGRMAHTRHPFINDNNIVRDFCENQVEINTTIYSTAREALQAMNEYTIKIQRKLASLDEPELLWPFSSPPFIKNEDDIPVAIFEGEDVNKTEYREYLSDRYGRYKMTFSGIHVNYSFSDELLEADFKLSGYEDFNEYKNNVYLNLAKKASLNGWIVTVLTAASPLLDASFVEKGVEGKTVFNGMASSRCSELGYWNYFTPIFNYENIKEYANSIQKYVDQGLLASPTELYYPIRLKPKGINNLDKLKENGVNHIELRMVDLNPLVQSSLHILDLQFIQLFLVWLACMPDCTITAQEQVQAIQNFKNAAHFDLKTVKILKSENESYTVTQASNQLIEAMKEFYKEYPDDVLNVLDFEQDKILNPEKRYAWILRDECDKNFAKKGFEYAKKKQEKVL